MDFVNVPNDKSEMVLSRDQVRRCDQIAIERFGVSGLVLMENAGRGAAEIILRSLAGQARPLVGIFCGTGNNGGDGFVVARHLLNSGVNVRVFIVGRIEKISGDALVNLQIVEKMGLEIAVLSETPLPDDILKMPFTLLVDALLGTGTAGAPREPIRSVIQMLNAIDVPIISLDIPSGLDCDSGEVADMAIQASQTITFAAMKKGFMNPAAREVTGQIHTVFIGIATELLLE